MTPGLRWESGGGELQHWLLQGHQYHGLMQSLTSLLENRAGERLPQENRFQPGASLIYGHTCRATKLFFRRLENHMILAEQFSREVPERTVAEHRERWLELVTGHSVLQSEALRHGVHMETTLQVWAEVEAAREVLTKEAGGAELQACPSVGLAGGDGGARGRARQHLPEDPGQRGGELAQDGGRPEEREGSAGGCGQPRAGGPAPHHGGQVAVLEEPGPPGATSTGIVAGALELVPERVPCHWGVAGVGQKPADVLGAGVTEPPPEPREQREPAQPLPGLQEGGGGPDPLQGGGGQQGRQLLALQQGEGTALRAHLEQLERGWAQLVGQLPGIQERLQQLQVEQTPSCQLLAELSEWISGAETWLRRSAVEVPALGSSAAVKQALRECQHHKMEMSCRQLAVDL
ncbi:nesprin-1-like [Pristis pectinata]|uniref:nesprin-1-like n=1 Tax=Pristis pectinata TaxID=685728 RepID=UPI00223E661B|nr:nesprin-1-like [Pristis pectinata]